MHPRMRRTLLPRRNRHHPSGIRPHRQAVLSPRFYSFQKCGNLIQSVLSVRTAVSCCLFRTAPRDLTGGSDFGDVGDRHRHIDHNFFDEILFRQRGIIVQCPAERFDHLLSCEGKARSHRVAAEFCHQFFAFAELLIHRIRFDRAAGALDALLTSGEYEGWFVEVLPQATCDDSGKTFVAVRQIDDETLSFCSGEVSTSSIAFASPCASALCGFHSGLSSPRQALQPPHVSLRRAVLTNAPPCQAVPMR